MRLNDFLMNWITTVYELLAQGDKDFSTSSQTVSRYVKLNKFIELF